MSRSTRASSWAAACAVLSAGVAWAQTPETAPPDSPPAAPDQTPAETATIDMARIDLGGSYYRGTALVGYGTREPYQGLAAAMHLDVMRFPTEWLGIEVGLWLGTMPQLETDTSAGLESAVLVAPLRWRGAFSGSLVLGAGGCLEGAERPSLEEDLRVYPVLLAYARLWPARTVSLHTSLRFAPITSNELTTRIYKAEMALGIHWAQIGARIDIEETTGGDPERTYRELRYGPFFGAAFY